jgi:hypothetical protein
MKHRGLDSSQSGSDQILINSNGKMVRAQAKNSILVAEQINKNAKVGHAHPIKVQDGVKYTTLKK